MIYNLSLQYDIQRCKTYLESLIKKQAKVEICIKKDKRTLSQNSTYWLWITAIQQETGNDKNLLHEYFKQKFLGTENITVFDSNLNVAVSTTKLDTKQMSEYMNRIQEFANIELGILLPNPSDLIFNDFYEHYKDFI